MTLHSAGLKTVKSAIQLLVRKMRSRPPPEAAGLKEIGVFLQIEVGFSEFAAERCGNARLMADCPIVAVKTRFTSEFVGDVRASGGCQVLGWNIS